jgi:NADH:ubiquinone oxidoreductase 24 kD subunit
MREVTVCVGSSCHLKGAYNVIQTFQQFMEEHHAHDRVVMKAAFCMKQCQAGVSVTVDGAIHSVTPENARTFFVQTVLNSGATS